MGTMLSKRPWRLQRSGFLIKLIVSMHYLLSSYVFFLRVELQHKGGVVFLIPSNHKAGPP